MIRIAIQSKGRLNEESLSLLQDIGIEVDAPKRKLLSKSQTFPIEALYLRDDDIPRVVSGGSATLGIVGLNEIEEKGWSLVPSKYIEFRNRDEQIDFDTKMKQLQAEMRNLLQQEEESKQQLKDLFNSLGYGI